MYFDRQKSLEVRALSRKVLTAPAAQLLEVIQTYQMELHPDLVLRRAAGMRLVRAREDEAWFVRPVGIDLVGEVTWEGRVTGLQQIGVIYTLHEYGGQGRFKASWAEVLAMLPDYLFTRVKAVEIIGPETAEDQLRQHAAREAGLLVALTLLYSY